MEAPRQSAAVLIHDGTGRVLLVHQAYGRRWYGLPGGIVDAGETPAQAAVREAREEAGVRIELDHLIGRYLLRGGDYPDITAYVFLARIASGEPRVVDPAEITSVGWFDPTDLPSPVLYDAVAALRDWSRGARNVVREHQREELTLAIDE